MPASVLEPAGGRPLLVFDGTESYEGRALFLISALHFCVDWLPSAALRFADVSNEDVKLALTLFQSQHGIAIDVCGPEAGCPLESADLYAAAAFKSGIHLRLSEANRWKIPAFVTIEYPDAEWISASVLLRRPAAFDPRIFADELGTIVKPWL